jgi:hypothetical protein
LNINKILKRRNAMAKCYFTGVNMPLQESYLLDFGPAFNALKDLRLRTASIQRIIELLSPLDDVKVYNSQKSKSETKRDRRLVSKAVAETLAVAYPEGRLFVSWHEWKSRYKAENNLIHESRQPGTSPPALIQASSSNE